MAADNNTYTNAFPLPPARAGLVLVAALALLYALPAFSFLFDLNAGLSWLHGWYATLVSESYASAPQAYENAQRAYIHVMSPFMLLHVGGMATALLLGWVQFVPAWRRARPQLHRALGSLFLLGIFLGGAGAVGMVFGGGTYGAANPLQQLTVEQGMLMLAGLMWLSALVALRWLSVGDLPRHGDWMLMTYALVCTALPQRIGFLVYGWQGYDYETSFQLTTQFIVQPMVLLAVWLIAARRVSRARQTEALPATAAFMAGATRFIGDRAAVLFAGTGALFLLLAVADVLPFNDYAYHLGVRLNVGVAGVALLVAARQWRAAVRHGFSESAAQWLLRGLAVTALPLMTLLVWIGLLPAGKSTDILLNTAPVFAAGAVFMLPEIVISALAWTARRRVRGEIDERGPLKVLLRPQPGKSHAFSDFLALTLGAVQLLAFVAVAAPAMLLGGLLRLLDRVPGLRALRALAYRPVGALAEALGRRLLADPRDMPVMHVIVQVSLTVIPLFLVQLAIGEFSWILWSLYLLFMVGPRMMQYQRLFSCAHNEGHRPQGYFRKEVHRYGKRYFENFLGQLFGEVQGNVHRGHVQVHHVEDAGYEDVQCMAHYDRTSLVDFAKFVGRENLLNNAGISLLDYFRGKGKAQQFIDVRNGSALHLAFLALVALFDWQIALAYVLFPKILFNVVTGGATFAQHAFYQPDDIHDVLACTTTFIFDGDFLNEGYHMSHHQRCAVHWTQMPEFFAANLELYREHDSVVFVGIDTLDVFMLLMLKRLDLLAPHVMDLRGGRSLAEIEAWLRLRTAPVPGVQYMKLDERKPRTPAVALPA
ncbi:MAG: DUF2306 domain-containing protein [Pseudomonadota bacterium]